MKEMFEFFLKYYDKMAEYLLQHISIVVVAFVLSLFIAIPLGVLSVKCKRIAPVINSFFNFVFSLPSMAMFALFIPIFGLGAGTAVVVIAIYNQIVLLRNIVDGFNSIDPLILESAKGMGMDKKQVFLKIECPLAAPAICTGIRLAVLSTISMATLAAMINAGGIGRLLFDGVRQTYYVKIYWGAILAAALALFASVVLRKIEKLAMENATGNRVKREKRKKAKLRGLSD